MGLTDTIFGKPPETQIHQTPAMRPPGYKFAQQFFNQLMSLMAQPYPTFKGSIDPGLSPTMTDVIRRAQGYAQSSPPEILQGAQGSLGRFMNVNFLNPANSLFGGFGGAPNYFGANPDQRVYGGQPASAMTWQYGGPFQPPPTVPQGMPFGGGALQEFHPLAGYGQTWGG